MQGLQIQADPPVLTNEELRVSPLDPSVSAYTVQAVAVAYDCLYGGY